MLKIDDNLLHELGLGDLPVDEKNRLLRHIYETLEMRVGMTLAQQMSEEQLTEFESYIDKNDEAGALKWLETNFPDYKKVVAAELDKLKQEIKSDAVKIKQMIDENTESHPGEQPPTAQPPAPQPPQA